VTLSIGVVTCLSEDCDFKDVIRKADQVMYLAKKRGKNRIKFDTI
jgi:diguanylate cyclase (GGDEF)-like protein